MVPSMPETSSTSSRRPPGDEGRHASLEVWERLCDGFEWEHKDIELAAHELLQILDSTRK